MCCRGWKFLQGGCLALEEGKPDASRVREVAFPLEISSGDQSPVLRICTYHSVQLRAEAVIFTAAAAEGRVCGARASELVLIVFV